MPHPAKPHWTLDKAKTTIGKSIDRDRVRRKKVAQDSSRAEKSTGVKAGLVCRSVLEQSSLDDFMAQAALSRATFEADRWGARFEEEGPRLVAVANSTEPGSEEAAAAASAAAVKAAASLVVPIPWRPAWTEDMDVEDLLKLEGEAFLEWRRVLAQIEQTEGVVMTPYERNLDFWRQLWRCVERCDLLVQIVDARDPAFYRSRDLERYVKTRYGGAKRLLLLMNKSDFLPMELRRQWAAHFANLGVDVIFFSALRELHRMRRVPRVSGSSRTAAAPTAEGSAAADASEAANADSEVANSPEEQHLPPHGPLESSDSGDVVDCTMLLDEIRARLHPECTGNEEETRRGVVGFVGYPNVGKSSVINALFGAKKVSMSRTPGKTKHLQTLELPGSDLTLCDCPGLVFPSVVATKAHLAINGTVPIVELRDSIAPVNLIVEKMGVEAVAAKYGLSSEMMQNGTDRLGQDFVSPARRILAGFSNARGHFLRQKVPDETWSARRVLQDFCTGELLHCECPVDHGEQAKQGIAIPLDSLKAVAPSTVQPTAAQAKAEVAAAPAQEVEGTDSSDFDDIDAFLKGKDSEPFKGRRGHKPLRQRAR